MSETQEKIENTMPHEIVVDDNTSLRFLVPEDAERIFAIFQADPEIQRRVTWTHQLHTVESVRDQIRRFQESRSIRYAIVRNEIAVGYVGMWNDSGYMDGSKHDGWFGFGYFSDADYRGKGIIQKATLAMMSEAEQVFDVKRWAVYAEDDNQASLAVLKKLGFTGTNHIFDEPVMHTAERRWEKVAHE